MNEYTSCSVSCKVGSSRGTSQISDIFVKLIRVTTVTVGLGLLLFSNVRLRASSDSTRRFYFLFSITTFPTPEA
jgi:hypothetical protein